jgi:hypothetical protein
VLVLKQNLMVKEFCLKISKGYVMITSGKGVNNDKCVEERIQSTYNK